MEIVLLVIGIVVGVIVGWLWSNSRAMRQIQSERDQSAAAQAEAQAQAQSEREQRIAAETRRQEIEKRLEEQAALVEAVKLQLGDTFKALSSDALKENSQAFVERAQQTLEPVKDTLRRYEDQIKAIETAYRQTYGSLDNQLKSLLQSEQQLQRETSSLVTALRRPEVRGRWGEVTLHRVVEMAGMTEHCDFTEQVHVAGEGGASRPDMVVHLPGNCDIVVDSKVPLEAYLSALEAQDDGQREACLERHCRQLRQHVDSLASKAYWSRLDSAPEFVVMFVPAESFLSAAAVVDRRLMEDGMAKGVFLTTPVTLMALLKTAAHGWRQEKIAKGAQEARDLGRDLYDRLRAFLTHISKLGKELGSATDAYNSAVGSLDARVIPQARKFRDLGAAGGEDISDLTPIDTRPRELTAPEAAEGQ
jgi:DNA recombination protein RmuC